MVNLKDKNLVLFFTCGVSLKTWEKIGNLEREIKPYNKLSQYFKKIYFVTYGGKKDLEFKEKLADNISILSKSKFIPDSIYQFLIPLIYSKELKNSDIYKTNQMAAIIPALISKWIYGKKMVVRCGYEWLEFLENGKKSFWKRKIIFYIERIAYKNADNIILTSLKDKKFIENNFKNISSKIEIIPNYIDTELFIPTEVKKDKGGIIFVGRLHHQKNIFNLLQAISTVPCKLLIVGSGYLKEKIESAVNKKKISVEFKESIPNERLPEELNRAEIFILPSLYEGCPKTLLEAMSCGLPCIGAEVDGIKEIIRHKENGYLCGVDADSIKKAIKAVLEDKILQKKIGEGARQTILQNFKLEKILEREKSIYENL